MIGAEEFIWSQLPLNQTNLTASSSMTSNFVAIRFEMQVMAKMANLAKNHPFWLTKIQMKCQDAPHDVKNLRKKTNLKKMAETFTVVIYRCGYCFHTLKQ